MNSINRFHGPFRAVPKDQSDQMDALRGLSALGVAIGHANQYIVGATTMSGSVAGGLLAQGSVMVFFVLSGFLIGKSICRNIENHYGHGFSLSKFAADRAWRIYPPLLFAIALMFLIWTIAPLVLPSGTTQFLHPTNDYGRHGINFDWPSVLYTLVFRNGFSIDSPDMNGPLWSLATEVTYYIIAGGVASLLGRPILAIIWVLLVARFIGRNDSFTDFAIVWVAGYMLSIAHNNGILDRRLLVVGFLIAAAAAMFFAVLFAYPDLSPGTNWIARYNVAVGLAFTMGLGGIVSGAIRVPDWVTRAFRGVAAFSYTLYLIHVPLYLLLFGILEQQIVGSLALSLLAAASAMLLAIALAKAAASVVENKQRLRHILTLGRG